MKWKDSWKYLLTVLGVAALILLVSDFNRRTVEARRLTAERDRVSMEVTQLVETNQYLETRIAYATSDVAVYEWARSQQRLIQEGDQPVIVVPPANVTPMPTSAPATSQKAVTNWQLWVGLFFDQPTPQSQVEP